MVAAGCGLATTMVQVICVRAFDKLKKMNPEVRFDCYIDDITLTSEGSEAMVLQRLAKAFKDLVHTVEAELSCTIEWSKAAVIASNDTLAQRLRAATGIKKNQEKAVANLGVDFSFGVSRTILGKLITRYRRIAAAKKRKGRLYILKKVLGPKRAALVATTGVVSAATYGATVNGVSDRELLQLRRTAAAAMSPSARGRSLSALLILRGDPCWAAAVAPLTQWIRASWKKLKSIVNPLAVALTLTS